MQLSAAPQNRAVHLWEIPGCCLSETTGQRYARNVSTKRSSIRSHPASCATLTNSSGLCP